MLNVIFMPDLFSLRIFKIIVNNLHRKYIHLLPSQYNFSDFIFITDLLASLVCKTIVMSVVILQTWCILCLWSNFQDVRSCFFFKYQIEMNMTGVGLS